MTKEQLREKLDNIRCWLRKIDYEELHKVYAAFNWQWGGYEEPKFVPEYRDLKRLVLSLFDEMSENMLSEFKRKELYGDLSSTIHEEIERNNLCVELTYDRDEDDIKFFVSVKKLTSVVFENGAENFQVNGNDKP